MLPCRLEHYKDLEWIKVMDFQIGYLYFNIQRDGPYGLFDINFEWHNSRDKFINITLLPRPEARFWGYQVYVGRGDNPIPSFGLGSALMVQWFK